MQISSYNSIQNGNQKIQFFLILLVRVIIGYHFLYEGVSKLLNEFWTAEVFLNQSSWIFAKTFQ